MGDMFKPRKIPKHLIIQEHHVYRRKPGSSLWKWMLWLVALLLATGMALQWRYLNGF